MNAADRETLEGAIIPFLNGVQKQVVDLSESVSDFRVEVTKEVEGMRADLRVALARMPGEIADAVASCPTKAVLPELVTPVIEQYMSDHMAATVASAGEYAESERARAQRRAIARRGILTAIAIAAGVLLAILAIALIDQRDDIAAAASAVIAALTAATAITFNYRDRK